MVSVMSERRMNRLNNPALSVGFTGFPHKVRHVQRNDAEPIYRDMQIVEQRLLSPRLRYKVFPLQQTRKISFQWG